MLLIGSIYRVFGEVPQSKLIKPDHEFISKNYIYKAAYVQSGQYHLPDGLWPEIKGKNTDAERRAKRNLAAAAAAAMVCFNNAKPLNVYLGFKIM